MSSGDQRLGADEHPTRDGRTERMLPEQEVQFPATVHQVHRAPLGLTPPPLLALLTGVTFVIAFALLVVGSWIAGLFFLVMSGIATGLLVVAIRRDPEAQTSRVAITAADRTSGFARLTAVAVRASTRAGLELARLWGRRRRVHFELRRRLAPLGEAVHVGDQERALQLKAQADELDQSLRDLERRSAETVAALRQQIEGERATSQSTEQLRVVDSEIDSRR